MKRGASRAKSVTMAMMAQHDFVRTYVYGDAGNLTYEEVDDGANRVEVAVTCRFYDGEGRLVR
jgi:hypothetical protein